MTPESAIEIIKSSSDEEQTDIFDSAPVIYPDGKYDPVKRVIKTIWASNNKNLRVTGTVTYVDGGHGVQDIPSGIIFNSVGNY